jgi:hypothetical protein
MNQNPIASGNQMPPQPVSPEPQKHPVGPIAGAIIVIILLIAGGLYFWGAQMNESNDMNAIPFIPGNDETQLEAGADVNAGLPPQSSSDDVSAIEADMAAMDMGAIDAENSASMNNI